MVVAARNICIYKIMVRLNLSLIGNTLCGIQPIWTNELAVSDSSDRQNGCVVLQLSSPPPRFRTSLTGGTTKRTKKDPEDGTGRYRVSYAHREPPSRETGASAPPLLLSIYQWEWKTRERRSKRNDEESSGGETNSTRAKKKTENRTAANSFDPEIAVRYLLAGLVIDPSL